MLYCPSLLVEEAVAPIITIVVFQLCSSKKKNKKKKTISSWRFLAPGKCERDCLQVTPRTQNSKPRNRESVGVHVSYSHTCESFNNLKQPKISVPVNKKISALLCSENGF
jgi:hypothetical protein